MGLGVPGSQRVVYLSPPHTLPVPHVGAAGEIASASTAERGGHFGVLFISFSHNKIFVLRDFTIASFYLTHPFEVAK